MWPCSILQDSSTKCGTMVMVNSLYAPDGHGAVFHPAGDRVNTIVTRRDPSWPVSTHVKNHALRSHSLGSILLLVKGLAPCNTTLL